MDITKTIYLTKVEGHGVVLYEVMEKYNNPVTSLMSEGSKQYFYKTLKGAEKKVSYLTCGGEVKTPIVRNI